MLCEGREKEKRNGKNYKNFPKTAENPVCHVRPHAQNSKDTYELPDGRQYPKQCFWLNFCHSWIRILLRIDNG